MYSFPDGCHLQMCLSTAIFVGPFVRSRFSLVWNLLLRRIFILLFRYFPFSLLWIEFGVLFCFIWTNHMVSVINFVSVRFSSVTHIAQYVFRFLCSLFTRFVIKNCFDDRLYGIVVREPALRAQDIFYRGVFLLSRECSLVSSRFCFVPS